MASNIRVRMYRPGFGDCFLVSFGPAATAKHVLIDFGAHMHGEIGTMDAIMDSVQTVTKSKLALLIATHAHRDHISGFGKFAERFAGFEIEEVWLPWTDDPSDSQAASLKKKHLALYDALETHLRFSPGAKTKPEYEAAINALSNLRGNQKATSELGRGFGTSAKVNYLTAGEVLSKAAGIAGLSAEVLGPSRDKTFLSRMDPPASQKFLSKEGQFSDEIKPFPDLEIRQGEPAYTEIEKDNQPLLSSREIEKLQEAAELPAGRLALQLDNVRNNTSLVILFRYKGKTLLFPGDAQWGNWQSWIGTENARTLIGELDFLKVSHHGSDNATPVDVVSALKKAGLAVMVPTQIEPYPTIPRMPLLKSIETHCSGHIAVRSDWIKVDGAPSHKAPAKLPKGFKAGDLWIDYKF